MIKSIQKVLFGGLIIASIVSCKKGENDPFLSVKSRDSRITGEWKLTSMESTETEIESDGSSTSTETSTETFNGTTISGSGTYYNPYTDTYDDMTYTYSYSHEINIEKDGSYLYTVVADGDKTEEKGKWNWMDSKKKKTSILFEEDGIYTIDRLTNKELVLTLEYSNKNTSVDQSSSEMLYTKKMVFEKQK